MGSNRMLRQLTRLGARSGVTGSCRSMKTQGGQGDRGHVPTAFNHKDGVGRGGFINKKMIICLIQRKLKLWLIQKMQLLMLSQLPRPLTEPLLVPMVNLTDALLEYLNKPATLY